MPNRLPKSTVSALALELATLANLQTTDKLKTRLSELRPFSENCLVAIMNVIGKANDAAEDRSVSATHAALHRAGVRIVEVLGNLQEVGALFVVGRATWKSPEQSEVTALCIEQLAHAGLRERAFVKAQDYPAEEEGEDASQLQFVALLVKRLAEDGLIDAHESLASIYRCGDGLPQSDDKAREWYTKAAIMLPHRICDLLKQLELAYKGLVSFGNSTSQSQWQRFYQHQAQVANESRERLNAFRPGHEIAALIKTGESKSVEFKEQIVKDEQLVRPVAAFLNTAGGVLLIGITNDAKAAGIQSTLSSLHLKDSDGLVLWIRDKLRAKLLGLHLEDVIVDFPKLHGAGICRVSVLPSREPVFWIEQNDKDTLVVRMDNSSKSLTTSEAIEYVRRHWFPMRPSAN